MSDSDNFNSNQHSNETLPEDGPIPKKRSLVWQFFERVNQFRVRCYLCQHEQNYQGTTGNILRHMKTKHDLDLTLKGQQDPENKVRIKDMCAVAANISDTHIKIERKSFSTPSFSKPPGKRKQSFDEGYDVNPYEEEEDNELYPLESYIESEDPFHINDNTNTNDSSNDCLKINRCAKNSKSELDNERIKAETQYFIEKANYYKYQKHLTALQAKKVKIEIQKLTSNSQTKIE